MEEKKERKRGLDRNIRQCLTYVIKKDGHLDGIRF